MSAGADVEAIATQLLAAYDQSAPVDCLSDRYEGFDVADAYAVLARIAARRVDAGWTHAARKVGFTNRTIWEIYGVDRPFWAHIWAETLVRANGNAASVSLAQLVQPRIEPEVVFALRDAPPRCDDPNDLLPAIDWIAPGFEIVHCHYPDWKFTIADCIADFGLHGALVVGQPIAIDEHNREQVAAELPVFELTLSCDGAEVERGVGANVLDGPLHALAHLTRVLADHPEHPPLRAGELVTTGTITNAWPVEPGQVWTSDYGALGLGGLTATFA